MQKLSLNLNDMELVSIATQKNWLNIISFTGGWASDEEWHRSKAQKYLGQLKIDWKNKILSPLLMILLKFVGIWIIKAHILYVEQWCAYCQVYISGCSETPWFCFGLTQTHTPLPPTSDSLWCFGLPRQPPEVITLCDIFADPPKCSPFRVYWPFIP